MLQSHLWFRLLQETEKLYLEIEMLRARLSTISEVSLRVNESLNLGIVLQEVVEGARLLTEARYGALAVFDDSGKVRDFIVSGFTPEERQLLGNLPQGRGILGYLNEIREPLRLADLASHPQSSGFPENHPPMKTFLGVPIRHSDESLGNIYLTEKEGGREFTPEDEKTLIVFASQAAIAVLNVLRYQEERRIRDEIETERRRLMALVESSPVGVMVIDASTRTFASVNLEAQRILGMSPEPGSSLVRYHQVAIYRRTDGQKYENSERPLARALDRGEVVRAEEILLNAADGRTVTILVNATPIYSDEGTIVSAVAVLQDMTPLEEMERLRNDFLAMVSHELRTPLTVIKGATATVLSTSTPFGHIETRRFFRTIDEQVDLLSELVSNLLDATKIEAGALLVRPKRSNLRALVDDAVNTVLRAGQTNYVQVDFPPDLPPVSADPQRITQVLTNLLSNASKYSPPSSSIRLTASLKEPHVEVSVIDRGQGVSIGDLPKLFKRFSRVLGRNEENITEGHGLGLAICKGIIEAHGGRIEAKSEGEGDGTTITFTIPIARNRADESTQESTTSKNIAAREVGQTRILSVDDDPQVLRYVKNVLTDAGFMSIVTANPKEMMLLFELERPHLVLLDVRLPGTSGFELLQRLHEHSDVPVIFLSGSGRDENIVRALDMGAADYIVKPFSPTELIARIETALRKWTSQNEPKERRPYRLGDLTIDYSERTVTVIDRMVHLTPTEYKLLFELSTNAGRVLTHDQLLGRIWGTEYTSGESHLIRLTLRNLRKKLGDDARNPRYIFTEPGVGYRMARPSAT